MTHPALRIDAPATLVEAEPRFLDKLALAPPPPGFEFPCALWTASVNPSGYPQLAVAKTTMLGHRFAYLLYLGEIPAGMDVHHACERITCCQPHHLEIVPHGRHVADHNARRSQRHAPIIEVTDKVDEDGKVWKVTVYQEQGRYRVPAHRPTRRSSF
jgi:hypothetical protein